MNMLKERRNYENQLLPCDFHNYFTMGKVPAYMVVHDLIKLKIKDGTYPFQNSFLQNQSLKRYTKWAALLSELPWKSWRMKVLLKSGREGYNRTGLQSYSIVNKVTSVTECLRNRGFDVRTKSMYIDIIHATERLGKELNHLLVPP